MPSVKKMNRNEIISTIYCKKCEKYKKKCGTKSFEMHRETKKYRVIEMIAYKVYLTVGKKLIVENKS